MIRKSAAIIALLLGSAATEVTARTALPAARIRPLTAASPAYCHTAHNVGEIALTISNIGMIGYIDGLSRDCFTGEFLQACQYPRGGIGKYLWGAALWVGAVVNGDTLVSTGNDGVTASGSEFNPDAEPQGEMVYRSMIDPKGPYFDGAVSDQDFVAEYYDTCRTCPGTGLDPVDLRPHRPLNVRVRQLSYAWSYPHADDFVLFDLTVENMGPHTLDNVRVGIFVDADIYAPLYTPSNGWSDDISGFIDSLELDYPGSGCRFSAHANIGWTSDNDGDFFVPTFAGVPDVIGLCWLGEAGGDRAVTFNWWDQDFDPNLDFGPQGRTSFRIFDGGGMGTPQGDREKYHVLSNGEVDYDQARLTTVGGADTVWIPPNPAALALAQGCDTRFVVSVGGFTLEPGEQQAVPFALVAGDRFHTVAGNLHNLPGNPEAFYANLNPDGLVRNAVMAQWVYDNPGVDTDGDGYPGQFKLCGDDTLWVSGDGVPDWRAASRPPAPLVWATPMAEAILVQWYGFECETRIDRISGGSNFEGYNVNLSTSGAGSDFLRAASWDIEDYYRYRWDRVRSDWTLTRRRFTMSELMSRYGGTDGVESAWHPANYPRQSPYIVPGFPDSVFYFVPIGANACRFELETPIRKVYPEAPRPPYHELEQIPPDSLGLYATADGLFKYYLYECVLRYLLPGDTYTVSVTACDGGAFIEGAVPLESDLLANAITVVPLPPDGDCCFERVGNVDCDSLDVVGLSDVLTFIDHLFISGRPLCCPREADLDQSGGSNPTEADVSLGDLTRLIHYVFFGSQPPPDCADVSD